MGVWETSRKAFLVTESMSLVARTWKVIDYGGHRVDGNSPHVFEVMEMSQFSVVVLIGGCTTE